MEIVKPDQTIVKTPLSSFATAREMYAFARSHVFSKRRMEYERSRDSIVAASKAAITEHRFLREYVWCVHVAGFSAARVSKFYPRLVVAHGIEDASGGFIPTTHFNVIKDMAQVFEVWRNKAKAKAVQSTRQMIADLGWDAFNQEFVAGAQPGRLGKLPFMGPALSRHLARNLGNMEAVKPDVHLNRLAAKYGYQSAEAMCQDVSTEPAGMTDLVLWYAARDHGTL